MPITNGHVQRTDRTIGRPRPLTREDLDKVTEKRNIDSVKKLRDSHHMVARLLAAGLPRTLVARRSGYSLNRVDTLLLDPSFQNLLTHYREAVTADVKGEMDDFLELATNNMLKAERQIADKLDEAMSKDEFLPTRDLLAISRDAADRFGYGKKTTNVNVNIDFAAKLEAALRRSDAARVVEGSAVVSLPNGGAPTVSSPDSVELPQPIRRRA